MTTGQEKKKLTRKGGSEAPEQNSVYKNYIYILNALLFIATWYRNVTTLAILTIAYMTLLDPGMEWQHLQFLEMLCNCCFH